jgi:DNA-binding winged helix-turn-helix (wHTH) protein
VPAARLIERGELRTLQLTEVRHVLDQAQWLIDVCRRELRRGALCVNFARRPVLLNLLCCLGEAWPSSVAREHLIERAFGTRSSNESHRARLRVELGRLRTLLVGLGKIQADGPGYRLITHQSAVVQVLLPAVDGEHAALLALLSDGASWSTSALALALGSSQRTLQRALLGLEEKGRVTRRGRGRAQRWFAAPLAGLPFGLLATW